LIGHAAIQGRQSSGFSGRLSGRSQASTCLNHLRSPKRKNRICWGGGGLPMRRRRNNARNPPVCRLRTTRIGLPATRNTNGVKINLRERPAFHEFGTRQSAFRGGQSKGPRYEKQATAFRNLCASCGKVKRRRKGDEKKTCREIFERGSWVLARGGTGHE